MPPGIRRLPSVRLAAFQRDHPEVGDSIWLAGQVWHAWVPDGTGGGREVARCHLGDLLDRLAELTGWDG
jgi:hypothetical protein